MVLTLLGLEFWAFWSPLTVFHKALLVFDRIIITNHYKAVSFLFFAWTKMPNQGAVTEVWKNNAVYNCLLFLPLPQMFCKKLPEFNCMDAFCTKLELIMYNNSQIILPC